MTPEQYRNIRDGLDARPTLRQLVLFCNHWLPAVPFVCYPVLLVILNVQWFALLRVGSAAALDFMQQIARAILVPGITFWFGTALRARLNRPRPYEQPGFVPLVAKETKGHSFPSRHALSAAVLAMTWLRFFPAVGVAMVIITLLICALRVLVGVHSCRTFSLAPPWASGWGPWACGCCKFPALRNAEKEKTGIFKFVLDRVPRVWYYTSRSVCRHTLPPYRNPMG